MTKEQFIEKYGEECYYDSLTIIHDGYTEQYYRVLLDVVQAGTAIWGWLEWTSNNKFTK